MREDGPEDEDEKTIINFGYYDSNVYKCCFSLLLSFAVEIRKTIGASFNSNECVKKYAKEECE